MNEAQLKTIVGLLGGMQTAILHLSNVLCRHSGISPEELAQSFETTSSSIPSNVSSRAEMQMALLQIAAGLRSLETQWNPEEMLSRLLH